MYKISFIRCLSFNKQAKNKNPPNLITLSRTSKLAQLRVSRKVQWVKVLVAECRAGVRSLRSMWKKELTPSCCPLTSTYRLQHIHEIARVRTHTNKYQIKLKQHTSVFRCFWTWNKIVPFKKNHGCFLVRKDSRSFDMQEEISTYIASSI